MLKKLTITLVIYAICVTSNFAESSKEILKETGITGGLIVHLNCGDGKLTADLHINDSFLVNGLDANPANVAKARDNILEKNIYGKVTVERWDKSILPYGDNIVNLIVSDNIGNISKKEIMRGYVCWFSWSTRTLLYAKRIYEKLFTRRCIIA